MNDDLSLPAPGLAEVRITAASPDVAQKIAQALRRWFASTEQRSYPAGRSGSGTRLQITVDTTRTPGSATALRPWLAPRDKAGSV